MSGAVDMNACPYRRTDTARITCKCGRCAVCGYPKHTAIHGPVNDGGPGSKPYGHEFKPEVDQR